MSNIPTNNTHTHHSKDLIDLIEAIAPSPSEENTKRGVGRDKEQTNEQNIARIANAVQCHS